MTDTQDNLSKVTPEGKQIQNKEQTSEKSDKPEEGIQYNMKLTIVWGCMCCSFFGVADYLQAEFSPHIGLAGLYSYIFTFFPVLIIYNLGHFIKNKRQIGKFWHPSRSQYYVCTDEAEKKYELSWHKIFSLPFRAVSQAFIQVSIIITFEYTGQSGVNSGIIASIFAGAVVFAIIIFRIVYDEKLQAKDYIGSTLVVLCVVLIGVGETEGTGHGGGETELSDDPTKAKYMAILWGVITAIAFALNSWNVRYYLGTHKMDAVDLAFNGNTLMFVVMTPLYYMAVAEQGELPSLYFWQAQFANICTMVGILSITKALSYGMGGIVQSLDATKVIIQMLLVVIFDKIIPTGLQILGMVLALLGIFIIASPTSAKKE